MSVSFAFWRRHLAIIVLGFSSGLPLSLTGQAMQAWLTTSGVDLTTIGFLGLVAMPYSLKFLWAPLLDRFEPPFLGRRRGWLLLTQWGLALMLWQISTLSPGDPDQRVMFAMCAVAISFLSATQDIVFDAWRTDVLPPAERGMGSSLMVASYRAAMVLSGGVAFIWAEQWGSWARVYETLGALMAGLSVFTLLLAHRYQRPDGWQAPAAGRELQGFVCTLAGVVVGVVLARVLLGLLGWSSEHGNAWVRLIVLLTQIAFALPAALWMARRFGFATLNQSLDGFFRQPMAWSALLLLVLYKLGDAFAGSLTTPFLLKAMEFTSAEVGIVNKIMGLWASVIGALIGGFFMLRLNLFQSMFCFGVLQLFTNFGFLALAITGRDALGSFQLPPFDIGIASLDHAAVVDWQLALVIFSENFAAGLGTAAFLALMTAMARSEFSATQFALLSALGAVGRVYVSPVSGVLAPAIGWPAFFVFSAAMALPGLWLLWRMRGWVMNLDQRDLAR